MQKYILGAVIIIGLSIGGYIFLERDASSKPITQGISGKITLRTGNCMPRTLTEQPTPDESPCLNTPVSRTMYIRELTKQRFPDKGAQRELAPLVKTVKSDSAGFYKTELAPGTYSIFVKEKGEEYCSTFDGSYNLCAATVQQNKITNYDMEINYGLD